MKGLLCAVLFSFLALASSNPTCEECMLLVTEIDYYMTQNTGYVLKHLHDTFCKKEHLDEQECKYVAGHFPGMLDVVVEIDASPLKICMNAQQCPDEKPFMRRRVDPQSVTCSDCLIGMTYVWAHLNEDTVKQSMLRQLKSPLYCENPEVNFNRPDDCERMVDRYFIEMLDETLEFEYAPNKFCSSRVGVCEPPTTVDPPTKPTDAPTKPPTTEGPQETTGKM